MLPSFLIIGATKCGTTSLHEYLSMHSQIFMHPHKDLRFFTIEGNWNRGVTWYHEQFSGVSHELAIGEATNDYSRHPLYKGVPERIFTIIPDVRLIYVIRHPIHRIESHYRHRLVTGVEWRRPDEALQADPRYIVGSLYGHQLKQYLSYFSPHKIHVVRFERLVSDTQVTLRQICDFLGVKEFVGSDFPKKNVTAQRMVPPPYIRHISRVRSLLRLAKIAAKFVQTTPLHSFLKRADQIEFSLSRMQYLSLIDILHKDIDFLSGILNEDFSEWKLQEGERV